MKTPALLVAGFFALLALAPSARSAVLIEFSAEGGITRVNISGSLNTSGLSFGTSFPFAALNLKEKELWFTAAPGNYRFAFHSSAIPLWHALNGNGYAYSDVSGADFGFNDSAIGLPDNYVSGELLSTRFLIDGISLETLNPQSGVVLTLANGDTISVSVAAVPEPASVALLAGLGGMVCACVRRPRRSPSA